MTVGYGVSGLLMVASAQAAPPPTRPVVPSDRVESKSAQVVVGEPHLQGGRSGVGSRGVPVDLKNVISCRPIPDKGQTRSHVQGTVIQYGPIDAIATKGEEVGGGQPVPDLETDRRAGVHKKAGVVGDFVAGFDGLGYSGWIPPDTVLAVGSGQVVEAVNSGFAVFNKSGAMLVGYNDFAGFFSSVLPAGWGGNLFDPRVIYDPFRDRFAMLILGVDDVAQTSYMFVAITQTGDPSGVWWIWRVAQTFANTADSDSWIDYCTLGADKWGLYISGNLYYWIGGFKYSKLLTLNPGMFSGGGSNGWAFWNLQWPAGTQAFSLQAAHPHSEAGNGETFFVNSWSGWGNQLLLWKLTGDRTNSPTLTKSVVTVTPYYAIGENVGQPGTTTDIDGGDARVMNAVYAQRRVYAALTSDPDNDGTKSAFHVVKINVDSSVTEWEMAYASGAGNYYIYPAVTIAGGLDTTPNLGVAVTFSSTQYSVFCSGVVKIYDNHPYGGEGPFFYASSGEASYVRLDTDDRNRWGDYSGAAYDWWTGNLWTATQRAGTGNLWQTRLDARVFNQSYLFSDNFESGNLSRWSTASP